MKNKKINIECPCCNNPHGQCQFIACKQDTNQNCEKEENIENQEECSFFDKISAFVNKYFYTIALSLFACFPIGCILVVLIEKGLIGNWIFKPFLIIMNILGCLYFLCFVFG